MKTEEGSVPGAGERKRNSQEIQCPITLASRSSGATWEGPRGSKEGRFLWRQHLPSASGEVSPKHKGAEEVPVAQGHGLRTCYVVELPLLSKYLLHKTREDRIMSVAFSRRVMW